ncbi:MAG: hypothetical protein CL470_07015 [Acidimicrobiaceae bacterium]|nr:hypothetical protein [Acidimicrobiaceae bacterium]|tara:strand:+ start:638 stop:1546 length:909 start_codon:yes stop_codon:yes gene_type:complete
MKIGVAPGRFATAIHTALSQRANVEADILSNETDSTHFTFVIAVDDEPVPSRAPVRRYITHHLVQTTPWTVVAARHLLPGAAARGTTTPTMAPLPVSTPPLTTPPQPGVAILDRQNHKALEAALEDASIHVLAIDDPNVGILIDPYSSNGFAEPLRDAMSQEKVVIAMQSNEAAKDTILHDTNGYLLNKPSDIRAAVEMLVTDNNERARLAFEARKSVTTANWQRVVRALLLNTRTGTPTLEQFSNLPAHKRWSKRLGHAHLWRSAEYDNGSITLEDRTLNLHDLGPLRKTNLERSVPKRDR